MTLCVAVKCEDGILIASDSRTVYGRGVPISRDTNEIHILEKEGLVKRNVALVGAGAAAFIDKFIRGFLGADLVKIARDDLGKEELSLSEALSKVARANGEGGVEASHGGFKGAAGGAKVTAPWREWVT